MSSLMICIFETYHWSKTELEAVTSLRLDDDEDLLVFQKAIDLIRSFYTRSLNKYIKVSAQFLAYIEETSTNIVSPKQTEN